MKFVTVKKDKIVKKVQYAYIEQYAAAGWTVVKETAETATAETAKAETATAETAKAETEKAE